MVTAYTPKNLREALVLRRSAGMIPFAGGTDLMVRGKTTPGALPGFDAPVMFIGEIDELRQIDLVGDRLVIGAACTLTQVLENQYTPPLLKAAIGNMASVSIRNIATIGGNICNASPAGDTLPPLYVHDATVVLESYDNAREVPIQSFVLNPGETTIAQDELLTRIVIPLYDFDEVFYRKIGTRRAMALSKLSIAAAAKISGGRVEDIRIAFGAVAPTVVRSRKAETIALGIEISRLADIFPRLEAEYLKLIRPIDDQRSTAEYRRRTSLSLLRYFLTEVLR